MFLCKQDTCDCPEGFTGSDCSVSEQDGCQLSQKSAGVLEVVRIADTGQELSRRLVPACVRDPATIASAASQLSVEWSGWITPQVTGWHTFVGSGQDFSFFIGGERVFTESEYGDFAVRRYLTAGHHVPFLFLVKQASASDGAVLQWTFANAAFRVLGSPFVSNGLDLDCQCSNSSESNVPCSGNGVCVLGTCICNQGTRGFACEELECINRECHGERLHC